MKKILLFMTICVLSLALTSPAMAFNWTPTPGVDLGIYGNIGISTEYHNTDEPVDDDTSEYISNNSSTLGAVVKAGNFDGKWELGFLNYNSHKHDKEGSPDWDGDTANGSGSIYARIIKGTYAFNEMFKLTVGQQLNPSFWWCNANAKDGSSCVGFGSLFDGFNPQIRADYGPVYVVFNKPYTDGNVVDADDETTAKIPKVYVGFDKKIDKHAIGAGAGYNSYEITAGSLDKKAVASWVAYVHGQFQVTDSIYLKSNIYYAKNGKQFGIFSLDDTSGATDDGTGDFYNAKTIGAYIQAKADFGKFRPFVGYGMISQDRKDDPAVTDIDKRQEYYIGTDIDIWKTDQANLVVGPEIHVFDEMDDETGSKDAKTTVISARWKLSF